MLMELLENTNIKEVTKKTLAIKREMVSVLVKKA
jgi:hypothetical protein